MVVLLTPLSPGFLRCIQLLLAGLSAGQGAGLELDPSKVEEGGDPTAAGPHAAWHRAYTGTTGKKPAEAAASSPVTAETLLRVVIAHAMQAKKSIAEAASMLPAAEEPATPAVWVELAAAVTDPGASATSTLGADDDLLLRRVRGVLEVADAQVVETEAMLAAIAPQLCTALLEARPPSTPNPSPSLSPSPSPSPSTNPSPSPSPNPNPNVGHSSNPNPNPNPLGERES